MFHQRMMLYMSQQIQMLKQLGWLALFVLRKQLIIHSIWLQMALVLCFSVQMIVQLINNWLLRQHQIKQQVSFWTIIRSNLLIIFFKNLIILFNSYYLLAIGSRSSGSLRFGVRARMQETTLTGSVASSVLNEIQRIDVTATVQAEQQVRTKKYAY